MHRQDLVAGLRRREQVADRADAADAGHERRHLVERAALAQLLEAAQLRDVELGVAHAARVVELQGDPGVTLDAGDRVDRRWWSACRSHRPKRVEPFTTGMRPAASSRSAA